MFLHHFSIEYTLLFHNLRQYIGLINPQSKPQLSEQQQFDVFDLHSFLNTSHNTSILLSWRSQIDRSGRRNLIEGFTEIVHRLANTVVPSRNLR